MLTIYDLDNPGRLKSVLAGVLADKGVEDIRYKNVSSYQDATFLVNDRWIVKLGLSEDDYYKFGDQQDLYNVVRPYTPSVQLPDYEAKEFPISYPDGHESRIFAARYQKLDGIVLKDFEDLENLPTQNREKIMISLAQFAADLHNVPVSAVEDFFPNSPYAHIKGYLWDLDPTFKNLDKQKQHLLTSSILSRVYPEMDFCLCHNDLRPQNFCLSEQLDKVTGVFDFGCADIGTPERDVLQFVPAGSDRDILKKTYESITRRTLNEVALENKRIVSHAQPMLLTRVREALKAKQYV